jgi:hypothetical protein
MVPRPMYRPPGPPKRHPRTPGQAADRRLLAAKERRLACAAVSSCAYSSSLTLKPMDFVRSGGFTNVPASSLAIPAETSSRA